MRRKGRLRILSDSRFAASMFNQRTDPDDYGRSMFLVNTETIPGYTIVESRGLVSGNTIRAKHLGRDIGAGFKNLVGGELTGYTELLNESRQEATHRMITEAMGMQANAIVNIRFTTSAVAGGAAELYAYGTAVVVQPNQAPAS